MFLFKKDHAGPTRLMYYTSWNKNNTVIRSNRKMPKPIYVDHEEVKRPIELSQSFVDLISIQKFWEKSYETSEFKMNYTNVDITRMFKNDGLCLCLRDSNNSIYATLFSYGSYGPIYFNGKIQNVRFIDGAVVNHKFRDEILHWLFSWMEYLIPSIYMYSSENLPNTICSSYTSYNYYGISASFIREDSVGLAERLNKSEFSKYQELFIKKYKNNLNIIYSLNSESLDLELYKVPIQFHSNAYYIVGVVNTKKTYKKYGIPVYEVIFCISVASDKETIINPSEEEKYLTLYVIETVCKTGNYPMLLISNKEVSGDI